MNEWREQLFNLEEEFGVLAGNSGRIIKAEDVSVPKQPPAPADEQSNIKPSDNPPPTAPSEPQTEEASPASPPMAEDKNAMPVSDEEGEKAEDEVGKEGREPESPEENNSESLSEEVKKKIAEERDRLKSVLMEKEKQKEIARKKLQDKIDKFVKNREETRRSVWTEMKREDNSLPEGGVPLMDSKYPKSKLDKEFIYIDNTVETK
jgi:DNA polymerase III gamma/tau subunit